MAFLTNDKVFSRKWVTDYLLILTGSFILGIGFVLTSVFIDGITMLRPDGDAPLVDDVLLSCVFGRNKKENHGRP